MITVATVIAYFAANVSSARKEVKGLPLAPNENLPFDLNEANSTLNAWPQQFKTRHHATQHFCINTIPNSITPTDFHRNFSAGKVVDTNHESRGQKQSWHVEMFATKSVKSPRQTRLCRSNGIWSVTMRGESRRQSSRTQITKVCDTNHESRRRDLCRRLSWFVSATSPRRLCRELVADFVAKSA